MKYIISLVLAFSIAAPVFAADQLIIISPHRKSIQQEFIPTFKAWYKKEFKTDVEVDWLDQGGTSDDVRFVRAKFKGKKTSGIDIFWGGGTTTFLDLNSDGHLAQYKLPNKLSKEVPEIAAGTPLFDKSKTWYASAMSSFGIFFNKKMLSFEKLPTPKTWTDLTKPIYNGHISLTDPRRSGSASIMNAIVMQSRGWDKGWELLTQVGGNVNNYTHSSSAPIKAVVAGDASVAMAIDFYANAKIGDLGEKNLGFILPKGQTVLNSDPVAILKGAPNRKTAERFVNYLLSANSQKLLVLPKGSANGPKFATLGRVAVNKRTYSETKGKRSNTFNPFSSEKFMDLDLAKASKMQRVFNDLFGAIVIDTHRELRQAWKAVIKRGSKPAEVALFGKSPVTEKEVLSLSEKWDDNILRTKKINEWTAFAKSKYTKLASK
jgi:ABC-type Fe3+ transport system substrate-binding protein